MWINYITSLLFCSADFHLNSKIFSIREAVLIFNTFCHKLLTSSHISTDLKKSRSPVWHVRPPKVWHPLPSLTPCVTMLNVISSAPATPMCLTPSPSPRPRPHCPTTPTLARNRQQWVSSRNSFCHCHHDHLTSYPPFTVLHISCAILIILFYNHLFMCSSQPNCKLS